MDDETASADGPAEDPTPDEVVAATRQLDTERRLWVRSLTPLLALRSRESDPSDRVQLALDLMMISACDRIRELLRGEIPSD